LLINKVICSENKGEPNKLKQEIDELKAISSNSKQTELERRIDELDKKLKSLIESSDSFEAKNLNFKLLRNKQAKQTNKKLTQTAICKLKLFSFSLIFLNIFF
jgi:predicted transcriptional regulator